MDVYAIIIPTRLFTGTWYCLWLFVVCVWFSFFYRQLGYPGALLPIARSHYENDSSPNFSVEFFQQAPQCQGNETRLIDCSFNDVLSGCALVKTSGVVCRTNGKFGYEVEKPCFDPTVYCVSSTAVPCQYCYATWWIEKRGACVKSLGQGWCIRRSANMLNFF